jgi:hypothetical protein
LGARRERDAGAQTWRRLRRADDGLVLQVNLNEKAPIAARLHAL